MMCFFLSMLVFVLSCQIVIPWPFWDWSKFFLPDDPPEELQIVSVPAASINVTVGTFVRLDCIVDIVPDIHPGQSLCFINYFMNPWEVAFRMDFFHREIYGEPRLAASVWTVVAPPLNNTMFQCTYVCDGYGENYRVGNKTVLRLQGPLSSVGDLSYSFIDDHWTVNISWSPPFTLPGTNITGYNISATSNNDTNTTNYFTSNNYYALSLTDIPLTYEDTTTQCEVNNITIKVSGYNGLEGDSATIDVPASIPPPPVDISVVLEDHILSVVINDNNTQLCPSTANDGLKLSYMSHLLPEVVNIKLASNNMVINEALINPKPILSSIANNRTNSSVHANNTTSTNTGAGVTLNTTVGFPVEANHTYTVTVSFESMDSSYNSSIDIDLGNNSTKNLSLGNGTQLYSSKPTTTTFSVNLLPTPIASHGIRGRRSSNMTTRGSNSTSTDTSTQSHYDTALWVLFIALICLISILSVLGFILIMTHVLPACITIKVRSLYLCNKVMSQLTEYP